MYRLLEKILQVDEARSIPKLHSCSGEIEKLTRRFLEKGIQDFWVITGYVTFSEPEEAEFYHVWIKKDRKVIDPTKDQFIRLGFDPDKIVYSEVTYKDSPKEYLSVCREWGETMPFNESSIDFPRESLDSAVWDMEDGNYVLKDEVKKQIIDLVSKYPDVPLLEIAKEIRIVGSIATNQFLDTADCDIHIVPDMDKLRKYLK